MTPAPMTPGPMTPGPMTAGPPRPATIDDLVELLRAMAGVPSEEPGYSELDHGLQCAAELLVARPDDVALQLAGLVHDVGHAFGDDASHGSAGRAAVEPILGERIGRLVEDHVPAKRYLVMTDPEYQARLSPVSVQTLEAQGGPLPAHELEAFLATEGWADAVELRRADDRAKVPGRDVPGLEHWLPALQAAAHDVARSRS